MGTTVGELFVKLGISTAGLDAGLLRARVAVKQTANEIKTKLRAETGQARDAAALLGRTLGVQLPAQVQKFIASSRGIGPVLAAAFKVSVVGAFAGAFIAFIPKIKEMAEEMGGLTQKTKDWADELARANEAILLHTKSGTMERLQQVNEQIAAASFREINLPTGQVRREEVTQSDELTRLQEQRLNLLKRLIEFDKEAAKGLRDKARALREVAAAAEGAAAALREATAALTLAQLGPRGVFGMGGADLPKVPDIKDVLGLPKEFPTASLSEVGFSTELRDLTQEAADYWKTHQEGMQAVQTQLSGLRLGFESLTFNTLSDLGRQLAGLGGSWKNFFRQVLGDLAQMIFQLLVVRPLMQAIFGAQGSGGGGGGGGFSFGGLFGSIFGGLGGLFGGGGIGQVGPTPPFVGGTRALGGPVAAGGSYLVGEGGMAERLTMFPGGGGVVTPLGSGGRGVVVNNAIDARGADAGVEFRVRRGIRDGIDQARRLALMDMRELAMRRA